MASRTTYRRALAVVLGAGTVATATLLGTTALFTDTASVPNSTVTSGTVHISTTPTTAAVSVPMMMPGDAVYTPITVKNTGASQLRYSVDPPSFTGDDGGVLSNILSVGMSAGNTSCDAAGWASGTPTGYEAPIAVGPQLVGSSAQGQDPGDRILNPGQSEVLCTRFSIDRSESNSYDDMGAPNAYEGKSITVTLTFNAEQTAHN